MAGLALLLLFNALFDRAFFEISARDGNFYGPIFSVARLATRVMLLSLGMTLVIATGGVDLSVGSVMALVGALATVCSANNHWGFVPILGVSLVVAAIAGTFNGILVSAVGLQPIVATLIMMTLGRGLALGITSGLPIVLTDPTILYIGRGFFAGMPVAILLVLAAFGITALLCRKTAIGFFIEALGDNEKASWLAGLPTRTIKLSVYIFSAICAALAALVAIGDVGRVEPDRLGQMLELDAITAVVVGGTALTGGRFSLAGSWIGALLVQTLTVTLIRQKMPSDVAPVPKALVILIVCLMQSPKLRAQLASFLPMRKAVA